MAMFTNVFPDRQSRRDRLPRHQRRVAAVEDVAVYPTTMPGPAMSRWPTSVHIGGSGRAAAHLSSIAPRRM